MKKKVICYAAGVLFLCMGVNVCNRNAADRSQAADTSQNTQTVNTSQSAAVEGGIFFMGNDYEAKPARIITIKSFYMVKYPVTQKEWQEVMGTAMWQFYESEKMKEIVGRGILFPCTT